uniref:Potassium channel tetramerisation-type BTB domain-containing protein n=1 Tax=Oryzias latipes TaxID=8090 RepID=A0A3P9LUA3_ORYLA
MRPDFLKPSHCALSLLPLLSEPWFNYKICCWSFYSQGRKIAEVPTNSEGWILIDRCGKHFGTILNYLRDGAVPLPDCRREIEELLAEAKYYLVQGLSDECTAALQNRETYQPLCKVLVQGEPGYEYAMLFLSSAVLATPPTPHWQPNRGICFFCLYNVLSL